jgi:hypothetical protein
MLVSYIISTALSGSFASNQVKSVGIAVRICQLCSHITI